jgi:uncharacterized protein
VPHLPHVRRLDRRWRGRSPSLRWRLQRYAIRYRGHNDAFGLSHSHFWADTADGVRLAGSKLGDNPQTAIVLVHGFMGYRTKPKWRLLAEGLAERFDVYTFDLRGHGQSSGACTGGEKESLDVQAVVEHARARGAQRIVTVGGSLGGIAVLREAADDHTLDGVVAISTPATWTGSVDSKHVKRAQFLFTSAAGRALARRLMGTRIHLDWGEPEPPLELVERIAPTPLLIIHGADDHFFAASDAEAMYERARDPKRLIIEPVFGHAEDGFTPEFAARLCDDIDALIGAKAG